MNEVELLTGIRSDLQEAPAESVIYLEGVTDPEFLFALLGLPRPSDNVHNGVLVKGLSTREGSGSTAVRYRVAIADRFDIPGVYGVLDGDGQSLDILTANFDPPFVGPLFQWKSYCIENLIAKTGWPAVWGGEPDWSEELKKYGPYLALNRVGMEARAILKALGLANFLKPILGDPLRSPTDISAALAAGKARLLSFDVEQEYLNELSDFDATVARSLDEVHAMLNGKWLLRHMAPSLTARDPDQCRFDWLAHARSVGGLFEVRDWWERVTGSPP